MNCCPIPASTSYFTLSWRSKKTRSNSKIQNADFFFSQSGGCQLGSKRKSKGLPKCHVISFQYFFFPFPCETFLYSLFCWYGPRFVRLSCARFSLDIGRCSSKKDIYHNFLLCMLFIQVQTYFQDCLFCVQSGKYSHLPNISPGRDNSQGREKVKNQGLNSSQGWEKWKT